jgi:hypothetical protein
MSLLRKATCKVTIYTNEDRIIPSKGTGFFIGKNLILTCHHVIESCKGSIEISKCHSQNGNKLTARVIDFCNICDYALLQLNEEFENEHILELCNSEIIEQENIEGFGFPDDIQGQDIGEPLKGTILMKADKDAESIQDALLKIEGFSTNTRYSGFSGSPIINEYGQVTSVLKYQAVRNLSSVSIRKAITFLEKNNIEVRPDQLQSFDIFNKNVFVGFEDRQSECEVESQVPIKTLSPEKILNSNKGELFYPKKPQNIKELIQFLRKSKDLNSKLWKGWIQLLTYVEILKGNYKDPNNINIPIKSSELYKKFGIINSSKTINMQLYLNFYFTEEEGFLKIARKLIHENKKDSLTKNICNIFNSNVIDFGNTNNIKQDISSPIGSGPSIQNFKVGILSLSQLNREIKSSNSLGDVSENLKKIFEDAIK